MPLYGTKYVEIEAREFDGSEDSARDIIAWARQYGAAAGYFVEDVVMLKILTLEGAMTGSPGDMIIRGLGNEFYPCKPDRFHEKYELVDK